MTPAEKARAALINDEIAARIRERRNPAKRPANTLPATLSRQKPSSRTPLYAAIFAFVLAAHVAAFIGFNHFKKAEAERQRQHTQALEDLRTAKAFAEAQSDQLRSANTRQTSQPLPPQQPPSTQWTPPRTVTPPPQPRQQPQIEYNVYTPKPAPRPVVVQEQPQPPPPPKRDRTNEHRAAARAHVLTKWGQRVVSSTTTQVPGWKDRYRTEGSVNVYTGPNRPPTPKRFEVLTQEQDGTIIASDLTRKW